MDIGALVGLLLGIAAVLVANVMEGGHLDQLLNPSASLLVLGGTLGATMASAGVHAIMQVPSAIAYALRTPQHRPVELIQQLVALAQRAR
ncbi:MAG TPA: motility-associated protein, partial [Gemmatimonadales bacterium]